MKKSVTLLLSSLLLLTNPLVATPVPLVQAQSSQTADTSSLPDDTSTSFLPTISYEIGEGEYPSDKIVIDSDSLFSNQTYLITDNYDQIVNQGDLVYHYMPKDHYRDITSYTTFYLYNDGTKQIQGLNPNNLSPDMNLPLQTIDLVNGNFWDITFKSNRGYMGQLTKDPFEAFDLSHLVSEETVADAKADLMRIEHILNNLSPQDSDHNQIEEIYDSAQRSYDSIAYHYDKLATDQIDPYYGISKAATDNQITQDMLTDLENAMEPVPDKLKQKVAYMGIINRGELMPSWNGSPIDAYATTDLNIFFAEDRMIQPAVVYHELGHIVDYASMIKENPETDYDDRVSFSHSDDFQDIFEKEWQEDGSYYSTLDEAFAQGFGAYALEKYQNQSMEEAGFEGFGLDNRPLTRAYFEDLFKKLDL